MNNTIKLLDTTLREGEQTPGVYFDVHIKIAIAHLLDEIGIDIIEAGHPVVSENIQSAVTRISHQNLKAYIGAHARSLDKDVELALECGVNFIGIFYCVSEKRLNDNSKNLNEAIAQIVNVIHKAREKRPELIIRYTPEDTVRSPFPNVIAAASEAVRAGANIISIADTTGFMIPRTEHNMYDYVKRLRDELAQRELYPDIAVHCHNDRGLALANAVEGYLAGAHIIDASVMGLGERAGIVDLASLITILAHDFKVSNSWNLKKLPELYGLVSEYSRIPISVNAPVCGKNAFTHCAGVHTQAAIKNPAHYQSLDPEIVGRTSEIALDHMSGMAALRYMLDKINETEINDDTAKKILKKIKEIGETGRTVDLQELRFIVRYIKENVSRCFCHYESRASGT
ncbi:MAG: 2-isopropylmalate synthase [Candidatus Fischerbacteria bacterium RBG_13_37_8]|uniref:2-isopropylmalate synthase n=1 Tax=Candidatus Fischerbacteria bacterium RBG_13_37_8 TaxID=1817863 RepID=A0A1F5VUS0_9BACT|nr:MAG: 2-isopropylmalate synthase [Candidatus Fischerbacteria bacterium RBG_13_37_8]